MLVPSDRDIVTVKHVAYTSHCPMTLQEALFEVQLVHSAAHIRADLCCRAPEQYQIALVT